MNGAVMHHLYTKRPNTQEVSLKEVTDDENGDQVWAQVPFLDISANQKHSQQDFCNISANHTTYVYLVKIHNYLSILLISGKIANHVEDSCCLCTLGAMCALPCLICLERGKMRAKYSIGVSKNDFLLL